MTGETAIGHDSESETDVGQCAEPGCYTRKINYYATDRQIEALNGLSSQCKQEIWVILLQLRNINLKFFCYFQFINLLIIFINWSIKIIHERQIKCNRAPLKVGGIEYSYYHRSNHGKESFSNWLEKCNSGGNAVDRGK